MTMPKIVQFQVFNHQKMDDPLIFLLTEDGKLHLAIAKDYDPQSRQLSGKTTEIDFFQEEESPKLVKLNNDNEPSVYDLPIDKLMLSCQPEKALKDAGFKTIRDLTNITRQELKQFQNIGNGSIKEIIERLEWFGLKCSRELKTDNEKIYDTLSVDTLQLTVRAANCLRFEDIKTVVELQKMTRRKLLMIPNMGITTLKHITDCLAKLGLKLAGED